MAKIVIDDTREIELLDAIKNPDAINFKFGDKFAELTNDLSKTKGSPQLKFSKDGNEYYIREIFTVPVDKVVYSKTFYSGGNGSRTSFTVNFDKVFTGKVTVSGSAWSSASHYNSWTSNGVSLTGIGSVSGKAGNYSFSNDVEELSGAVAGVATANVIKDDGFGFPTYISVNVRITGMEEV